MYLASFGIVYLSLLVLQYVSVKSSVPLFSIGLLSLLTYISVSLFASNLNLAYASYVSPCMVVHQIVWTSLLFNYVAIVL